MIQHGKVCVVVVYTKNIDQLQGFRSIDSFSLSVSLFVPLLFHNEAF